MPYGVPSINDHAFSGCNNISTLIYNGTNDPCVSQSTFNISAIQFMCVPESFVSSSFCGISDIIKSNNCETIREEINQCFTTDKNGTVQKKADVVEWEGRTTDCFNYTCDNNTGYGFESLCTGDNQICMNDRCEEEETLNDNWKVVIDVDEMSVTDWTSTELLSIISKWSGVDAENMKIGIETNDEGQIIRIIVIVKDEHDANSIVRSVESEAEKCTGTSGSRCWIKGARVDSKPLSLSEGCRYDVIATFLLMM